MKYKMTYKNEEIVFDNLGHVYEFVARELGFKDWNTLCGTSVRIALDVKEHVKSMRIRGFLKKVDEA